MQRSGDLVFPNLPAIRSKRFSLELRRNKIVMAKIIDWTRTIAFEKRKSIASSHYQQATAPIKQSLSRPDVEK